MVSKASIVDFEGKYDSQQPQLREQRLLHSKAIAEELTLDFQQRAFLSDILLDVAKTRLRAAGVPYQGLRYTPCFEATTAFKETQNGTKPPGIWKTLQGVIEPLRSTNTFQNDSFVAMHIEDFDDQMYAGITSITELYEKPNIEVQNLRTLWTGLGAQLARDVPFSAICWATLDPMRRRILGLVGDEASIGTVLAANFSAGFFAASVAAAATCPLDVANTRPQFLVIRDSDGWARQFNFNLASSLNFASLNNQSLKSLPITFINLTKSTLANQYLQSIKSFSIYSFHQPQVITYLPKSTNQSQAVSHMPSAINHQSSFISHQTSLGNHQPLLG